MKLIAAAIGVVSSFATVIANDMGSADKFYHLDKPLGPSMWAFGKSGVAIYSVDGKEMLKRHSNMDICGSSDCSFREALSDGKKYVFASNALKGTLDVFSIDSGEFMASLDTCGSPWSLDYHPMRDEVWVHCWGPDDAEGDTGHVDVFSVSSLHSPMSQVKLPPALVGHAHGTVVVDSTLGHIGYATDLNTPSLFSFDLNTRSHLQSYDIPNVSGLYRMGYSEVNRHLYLRAYVCCSCGYDGADLTKCGRGGGRPVNVTTGPNQGKDLSGTCGHGCEGSVADTIGVYEFDTVQGIRVANWQISDGFGADPYVSPKGDYIALFGNNGGNTVRMLKPGRNGQGSKLWADLNVGFKTTEVDPDEKSVSDATFIQDSNHNIVIFTSTLSNSIALVDLAKEDPVVSKLQLHDTPEITSNHGRGARRNVVWAVGTDYVWVDSEKTEEFHLIKLSPDGDVTKAIVERSFPGIGVRRLVFIENYEAAKYDQSVRQAIRDEYMENKTIDVAGSSGLAISCIALVLGLANMLMIMRNSRQRNASQSPYDISVEKVSVEKEPSLPSLP